MKVSDILFISFGQGGNNLTAELARTNRRLDAMYVNTNLADMRNIEDVATSDNRFIVPNAAGVGGNREKAKRYLSKNILKIIDLMEEFPDKQNYYITFSMSGGTGSGMGCGYLLGLSRYRPDLMVNVVLILPKRSESPRALLNTIKCWNEIKKMKNVNTIYLLDNERRELVTEINEEFADAFNSFINLYKYDYDQNSKTIDKSEIEILGNAKGVSSIIFLPNAQKRSITALNNEVVKHSIFYLNSRICAFYGLIAPYEFDREGLFDEYIATEDHWLCISDDRPMMIVSGCSIKENEEVFLDIKDIYEGRVFDEDTIDELDDITVNERKSPVRKVEKKEKEDKIDIESLTDEEWAKYLGL